MATQTLSKKGIENLTILLLALALLLVLLVGTKALGGTLNEARQSLFGTFDLPSDPAKRAGVIYNDFYKFLNSPAGIDLSKQAPQETCVYATFRSAIAQTSSDHYIALEYRGAGNALPNLQNGPYVLALYQKKENGDFEAVKEKKIDDSLFRVYATAGTVDTLDAPDFVQQNAPWNPFYSSLTSVLVEKFVLLPHDGQLKQTASYDANRVYRFNTYPRIYAIPPDAPGAITRFVLDPGVPLDETSQNIPYTRYPIYATAEMGGFQLYYGRASPDRELMPACEFVKIEKK